MQREWDREGLKRNTNANMHRAKRRTWLGPFMAASESVVTTEGPHESTCYALMRPIFTLMCLLQLDDRLLEPFKELVPELDRNLGQGVHHLKTCWNPMDRMTIDHFLDAADVDERTLVLSSWIR